MADLELDPQATLDSFAVFQICQILLLAIVVPVFLLDLVGYVEFVLKKTRGILMRTSLVVSGGLAIVFLCFATYLTFLENVDDGTCRFLAKSIGTSYTLAVLMSYIFLLEKARLVGRFEIKQKFYSRLFSLMRYGLALFVPVVAVLSEALIEGLVTPGGRCVQIAPLWYVWLFGIGCVFMTIALMYLFLHPVGQMAKSSLNTGTKNTSDTFRRVYRFNAYVGTFASVSTFCGIAAYASLHQIGEDGINDENEQHLLVYGMVVVCWDVLVLMVCTRITTFYWLPSCLRKKADRSSSQQGNTSPLGKSGKVPLTSDVDSPLVTSRNQAE